MRFGPARFGSTTTFTEPSPKGTVSVKIPPAAASAAGVMLTRAAVRAMATARPAASTRTARRRRVRAVFGAVARAGTSR